MLLAEGAIEETLVQNLLAWPHAGFGTHVSRANFRSAELATKPFSYDLPIPDPMLR